MMEPDSPRMPPFEKVEEIYHRARSIAPGSARDAWLAEHCRDDHELFREVASLLAAEAEMK